MMTLTEFNEIIKTLPDPEYVEAYEIRIPLSSESLVHPPYDSIKSVSSPRLVAFQKGYEEVSREGVHKLYWVYTGKIIVK